MRALLPAEASELQTICTVLYGLAAHLFVVKARPEDARRFTQAFDAVMEAYDRGDVQLVLGIENRRYQFLFEGAASETLSSMLSIVRARIWCWRALGRLHLQHLIERLAQSVAALCALLSAINADDADRAEALSELRAIARLQQQFYA